MKRIIQQRPLFPQGDTSIKTVIRKYNSIEDDLKLMTELPVYHQHDGYQLVYMREGLASFMVDDEVFQLVPGDLFYIPSNLPHAIVSIGENPEAMVIQFKDDVLPKDPDTVPEFKFVYLLLKKGAGGLAFRNVPSNVIDNLAITAGIGKITELYHTLDYLGRNIASARLLSKRIQTDDGSSVSSLAHQYLIEHYKDEIKLSDIALYCHQQEAALCRTYKRETGMTLFQHLQFIRIESACTMLRNTSLSISEVAYSCGFVTPSTFNRVFAGKMKMTPGEYRKL